MCGFRGAEQEISLLTSTKFLDILKMITSESLASPELTRRNFEEFQVAGIGVVKWIKQASKDGQTVIRSGQSTTLGKHSLTKQGHFTERMCCMRKSYKK